jgi:hypothetical protein
VFSMWSAPSLYNEELKLVQCSAVENTRTRMEHFLSEL